MSMLSLAPATTMFGFAGSTATAGSFCLFCEKGVGGLPTVTRVSGLNASALGTITTAVPAAAASVNQRARAKNSLMSASCIGFRKGGTVLSAARNAKPSKRRLEPVALLLPEVRLVVVAVALPEPRLVVVQKLETAQPLGALPEVLRRDDEPKRPPVIGRQRLAVGLVREQRFGAFERRQRHVRSVALLGVRDHESRGRPRLHELRKLAPVHALEGRVEPAPAGHAVDVDGHLGTRQRLEFVPAERDRILDLAEHTELPGGEVGPRHRAGVQHRPLLREVLAGRQSRGVVTGVEHLLLGLRPEECHPVSRLSGWFP